MTPKVLDFDALQKIKLGKESVTIFTYPGYDEVEIAIRPLTQAETSECISEGRRKCEEAIFKPTQSDYLDFQSQEVLYRAVLQVNDHSKTFFKAPEQVGEELAETLAKLIGYYNEVQNQHSPDRGIESEAEFVRMIDDVKKNSPLGMSLSSLMLRKLLLFTVDQLEKLQKDNGFTSSPSNQKEETMRNNIFVPVEAEVPNKTQTVEVTTKIENS